MQAFTAAPHHDVLVLVVQIALLLFVARALGEVAQRLRQPAVVGEILAGIILGPSLLSGIFPVVGASVVPHTPEQGHLLEVVSLFGAMFLLLITGLETDLQLIRRQARTALGASLGGILVPFATGYLLGLNIPDDLLANPRRPVVFALFIATAMSISAIPVIAKVLMDLNLMRRDVGQAIIAAGMTDDAIGWMLLSVVLGLAGGEATTAGTVLWAVGKVLGFMILSFTLGRWVVRHALNYVQDRAVSHHRILSLVVVLTFAWGAVSMALGLEAMLGAFVMGILFGQMPRLPSRVFDGVEQMAMAVFAPIFFAVAGLKVNIRTLAEPRLIGIALLVIGVACLGKIVGGYAGARILGRRDHWTALSFGVGMNARGAMEIIIASIGLSMGLLTQEMFSIIVVMAITTSLLAPPALRWTLSHVRPEKQEIERLRREEMAEGSLIAGVRRILVPVRCREEERRALFRLEAELVVQMRARSAVAVTLFAVVEECDRPASEEYLERVAASFPGIELTRKVVDGDDVAKAILGEAENDYDLIILGAPAADDKDELFDPMVDFILRMSPCPTMVVRGRMSDQHWPPSRILLPTNGTSASRAAADVAFALALRGDVEVLVLNVVESREGAGRLDLGGDEIRRQMEAAHAIVDELCAVGEAMGVRTRTEVRAGVSPEAAILELAVDGIDLVVLGTDLRPASDRLFLGPRVERVLNHAACPVVVMNAS
ncbi:MAG TPA: cation:proton antiporter [Longimicrobium sp.]|jgi:Kef-type K+ transport system membrane component KefB/nucleotide-binding universal stress UspA family protein